MSMSAYVASGWSYVRNRVGHKFRDLEDRTGEESIDGKIVCITGGNAGIGKVLTLQFVKRNAIVLICCRDVAKAERVVAEIKEIIPNAPLFVFKLDLSDLDSVRQCCKEITDRFSHINILINNAGYLGDRSPAERTKDGYEMNMATNYIGHFLLTLSLLKLINKGGNSRIVCLGSLAHETALFNVNDINFEKDTYLGIHNLRPYNNSKLALMLFARELAKRLENTQIKTYSLCPGLVETGLFDGMSYFARTMSKNVASKLFGCTPEQGAETVIYCAVSTECANESGKVYRFGKLWQNADEALDNKMAHDLFDVTEKLLDIKLSDFI